MNINKALFKFIKIATGILVMLLLIYLIIFLCKFCFDFGYRVFNEPAVSDKPGEDIMISISEDMSSGDIGKMLEEKGLVRDGKLFAVQLMLSAYKSDMEPGVYTLNTSMTAKDMMVKISDVNEAKRKAAEEAEKEKQEASQKETESSKGTEADTSKEKDTN